MPPLGSIQGRLLVEDTDSAHIIQRCVLIRVGSLGSPKCLLYVPVVLGKQQPCFPFLFSHFDFIVQTPVLCTHKIIFLRIVVFICLLITTNALISISIFTENSRNLAGRIAYKKKPESEWVEVGGKQASIN